MIDPKEFIALRSQGFDDETIAEAYRSEDKETAELLDQGFTIGTLAQAAALESGDNLDAEGVAQFILPEAGRTVANASKEALGAGVSTVLDAAAGVAGFIGGAGTTTDRDIAEYQSRIEQISNVPEGERTGEQQERLISAQLALENLQGLKKRGEPVSNMIDPAREVMSEASEKSKTIFGQDPSLKGEFTTKLAAGAGSLPVYLAANMAGGPLAAAGLGSMQSAQSESNAAIQAGRPDLASGAFGAGALIGSTEALGVGGGLTKAAQSGVQQAISVGKKALEEGGQEGAQQLLSNLNANTITGYDPQRKTGEGVAESALIGGIIGAGAQSAQIVSDLKAVGAPETARVLEESAIIPATSEIPGFNPQQPSFSDTETRESLSAKRAQIAQAATEFSEGSTERTALNQSIELIDGMIANKPVRVRGVIPVPTSAAAPTQPAPEEAPQVSPTDVQTTKNASPEVASTQPVSQSNEQIQPSAQGAEAAETQQAGTTPTETPGSVGTADERVISEPPAVSGEQVADLGQATASLRKKLELEDSARGQKLGILPSNPFVPEVIRNDIPATDLESSNPDVETRWDAAKMAKKSILENAKQGAVKLKDSFRRHFPNLDSSVDGVEIDILRQHEAIPQAAKTESVTILHGITSKLGPRKYDLFSRLVILPDMLRTIDQGLYEGKALPFGYKDREQVQADLDKFQSLASKNPDIQEAVASRKQVMTALRDELVRRDLLPESVKDFDDYFHRQVLAAMAMKDSANAGAGSKDVRLQKKGFQKKRKGSSRDFNTDYLESEFEVLSQAFSQIMTQDTLAKLDKSANIKKSLEKLAKDSGDESITWRSLIPEDYTTWQPTPGTRFYRASTLSERALESYLNGSKILTEEDFKQALVSAGPKEQWVIPKRLAKTLDDVAPTQESPVEKLASAGVSSWKIWTLINPFRIIKYNINNMSGDLDIALAYNPKILKDFYKSAMDLWRFQVRKNVPTPEIKSLIDRGVLNASFSIVEIPDIGKQTIFKALKGETPNIIERYWQSSKDFTTWREDILRLSAYRYFLKEIQGGKELFAASRTDEMRQIYDGIKNGTRTVEDAAAKLSRELVGDYGNVSTGGQWMRKNMLPFYSWMEINAPRYVRMFKNVAADTGRSSTEALTWAAALKAKQATGWLALRAGALYGMAYLWNALFFRDEMEEMGNQRGQMHLILGRNEDNSIRSVRVQGALSDALSFFGLEDAPADVAALASGKKSAKDQAAEMILATPRKLVTAATPIYKTAIESMAGFSLYPDPLKPRPIRDKVGHMARLLSLGTIYEYITDKPRRGAAHDVQSLAVYTTDVGEASYYQIKALTYDYLDKAGKERPAALSTKKSNALYYHKQALKFGNKEQAERWRQRYFDLGGTKDGISQSIKRSEPLAGLSKEDRKPFYASLSDKEKAMLKRAEKWYDQTYRSR